MTQSLILKERDRLAEDFQDHDVSEEMWRDGLSFKFGFDAAVKLMLIREKVLRDVLDKIKNGSCCSICECHACDAKQVLLQMPEWDVGDESLQRRQ